jgi:hypothetical protein
MTALPNLTDRLLQTTFVVVMVAAIWIGAPGTTKRFTRHAEIRGNHVKGNTIIELGKVVDKIFIPFLRIVT